MEHKLIRGGEQYLAFARGRIKALRATGMPYASQQFKIGGITIRVRIADAQDYIDISGASGIWALVNLDKQLDTSSGVDPDTFSGVNTTYSKLFFFSDFLPSVALLKHAGSSTFNYDQVDGATHTESRSNLYGALSGFAPYGGKAVTYRTSSQFNGTYFPAIPTGVFRGPSQTDTVFKWGSNEVTYTFASDSSADPTSQTGDIASGVNFLTDTKACFYTISMAPWDTSVAAFKYIKFGVAGAAVDSEGILPVPLVPSLVDYTRREVGSNTQGKDFIYGGNKLYDRKMNLFFEPTRPIAVSYDKTQYISVNVDEPKKFELYRIVSGDLFPIPIDGPTGKLLDFSLVQEIIDDSEFANAFAAHSGWGQVSDTTVSAGVPSGDPALTINLSIQFIVDQAALF